MNYNNILKQISEQENISIKEIETEMQNAINLAGLDCSAKEFVEKVSKRIKDYI